MFVKKWHVSSYQIIIEIFRYFCVKFWTQIVEVLVLRCTPFYILLDFAWFCSQVQAPPSKSKRKIILSGAFIPWRMAIFIPTLMCLPILALVTILHESPDWLIRRGRIEEYNKSMNFYQKLEVLYDCHRRNTKWNQNHCLSASSESLIS